MAGRAYIFTFCTSTVSGIAFGAYKGYNEEMFAMLNKDSATERAMNTVGGASMGFLMGACAGMLSPVLFPTVAAIKLKEHLDKKKE